VLRKLKRNNQAIVGKRKNGKDLNIKNAGLFSESEL